MSRICHRFTWYLGDKFIKEVYLPPESQNLSSLMGTASYISDTATIQVIKKNHKDTVWCSAEKLFANRVQVFSSQDPDEVRIGTELIIQSPPKVLKAELVDANTVEILVDALPAIQQGMVMDQSNRTILLFLCPQPNQKCSIIFYEPYLRANVIGQRVDDFVSKFTISFSDVSQSFHALFVLDSANGTTFSAPIYIETEKTPSTVQPQDQQLDNPNLMYLYVLVPICSFVIFILLLLCCLRKLNLFKCGRYKVVNDIDETEV